MASSGALARLPVWASVLGLGNGSLGRRGGGSCGVSFSGFFCVLGSFRFPFSLPFFFPFAFPFSFPFPFPASCSWFLSRSHPFYLFLATANICIPTTATRYGPEWLSLPEVWGSGDAREFLSLREIPAPPCDLCPGFEVVACVTIFRLYFSCFFLLTHHHSRLVESPGRVFLWLG